MNAENKTRHTIPGTDQPLTKQSIIEDMTAYLDPAVKTLGNLWERYFSLKEVGPGYKEQYPQIAAELEAIYHHLSMINDQLQAAHGMPSPYYRASMETLLDPSAE